MKFYSQYNQDKIIYEKFFSGKKDKGFFLEIGADDGIRFSNCKFFEETLNWDGIAIEPRKEGYNELIKNRKCKCFNILLSNKEDVVKFLNIKGYGLGLSGIVDNYDSKHMNRIKNELKKKKIIRIEEEMLTTKKLGDILEKNNITHIDFLSIDTEGSELDILSTIDFNKVFIDVITIEDNYNDPKIIYFFKERGYNLDLCIKIDKVFRKIK